MHILVLNELVKCCSLSSCRLSTSICFCACVIPPACFLRLSGGCDGAVVASVEEVEPVFFPFFGGIVYSLDCTVRQRPNNVVQCLICWPEYRCPNSIWSKVNKLSGT